MEMLWTHLSMLALATSLLASCSALPFNISLYNPVFDSPSTVGPTDNMPLGTGETTVNVWVDASNGSVAVLLGRSDSLSGYHKALKVGRVRLVLDPPLLSPSYLLRFEQQLDLASGVVTIAAQTKAGDLVSMLIWADTNRSFGVDAIHIEVNASVAVTVNAALDPWRTTSISNDTFSARGLCAKTVPEFADSLGTVDDLQAVFMFQENNESIYNSTLTQQMQGAFAAASVDPLLHRASGSLLLGRSLHHTHPVLFTHECTLGSLRRSGCIANAVSATALRISVYTNTLLPSREAPSNWTAVTADAVRQYEAALLRDYGGAKAQTAAWWAAFWERSWLVLTPAAHSSLDPAPLFSISQTHLLGRYLAAIQGRGSHNPVHFNGGTVTWGTADDPDWRPWGAGWWFQNVRHLYWPLLQTGDADVLASLYGMYARNRALCEDRAQVWYGHGGLDFVETQYEFGTFEPCDYDFTCDGRHGVPDSSNPYIRHHREGGVELATMLLQHYHTYNDSTLLGAIALPWAKSLVHWYQGHYPLSNGSRTLHLLHAQACETYGDCNNPADVVSGLTRLAQLLVALPASAGVSPTDRAVFLAFQASLPPIPRGLPLNHTDQGAATEAADLQVVPCAPGFPLSHINSENTETYALWPYEFFAVNRTEQLQYPLLQGCNTYARRRWPKNAAWGYDGPDAAVLGLAADAWAMLRERVLSQGRCQHSRFPGYLVTDTGDGSPQTESVGLVMTMLHKSLVQTDAVGSGGQRILLLPAWPQGVDVLFRLHLPLSTAMEGSLLSGNLSIALTPAARAKDLVVLEPQPVPWGV